MTESNNRKLEHASTLPADDAEKTRSSEGEIRDFANATSDWFWEQDENFRYIHASGNTSVPNVLPPPPDGMVGKTRWESALASLDDTKWQEHKATLEAHKGFRDFCYPLPLNDGGVVYLRTSGVPVFDQNGVFCGYRGTATDETRQVELLQEKEQAQDLLRDAIESLEDGFAVFDSDDRMVLFNSRYADISEMAVPGFLTLGVTFESIVSKYLTEGVYNLPEEEHEGFLRQRMEGHRNVPSICVHQRANGTWMQIVENPTSAGGVVLIQRDITDLKLNEESLRRSQRLEAIGQLTGGVAHDFNNLMAVMIGNAELLKQMVGEDEKARRCAEVIIQSVGRGTSLTSRLLAFSRQQRLSPKPTQVNDLVAGLVEMLQRTLGETIELKTVFEVNSWEASIDPHEFENALINLAINSRDAMPKGGVLMVETSNICLDVTYTEQYDEVTPGDYVKVTVSDTGIGMTSEVVAKAFEPFYTTKDVGEGSGLGLSMVYGFTKQSKGHVTIYSEINNGSMVELYLPRSLEAVLEEDAVNSLPECNSGTECILIVEDDEDVLEVSSTILKNQGYKIVVARNGEDAITLLKDGTSVDLLFTDMVLPGGLSGVEVAEHAKEIQPSIKTLYTSGYTENLFAQNGRPGSDITLIAKPYRRAELLEKIRAILGNEVD